MHCTPHHLPRSVLPRIELIVSGLLGNNSKLPQCLEFLYRELNLFPLWLCPVAYDHAQLREIYRRQNARAGISISVGQSYAELEAIRTQLNPTNDPLEYMVVDVGMDSGHTRHGQYSAL
jgi:hypothetical protein